MGDEGPGRGAAGDGLHHRRLDLDVPALLQEAADGGHHRAAAEEGLAHLGVGHEVEVALAVAHLDVGEAVPLLRRGQERLAQEDDLARLHGQLALARAHDPSRHAHEVAEVHEVEDPVGGLPHLVGPHVDLELGLAVAQGGEGGLPVPALREDPPRDPHLGPEGLELLERPLPVCARDLAQSVAALEAVRVHLDAQGPQGPRLLQPLGRFRRPAGDGGLPRRAARACSSSLIPLSPLPRRGRAGGSRPAPRSRTTGSPPRRSASRARPPRRG